jgi:hypothetical protein
VGDDLGEVEENPTQRTVRAQNRRERRPLPAPDIDDGAERGEVVAGHHRRVVEFRAARHPAIERRADLRVFRQIGIEGGPIQVGESRVPGQNTVAEMASGRPDLWGRQVERPVPDRIRAVAPQCLAQGCQDKLAVAYLVIDALAGEQAEQAV